MCLILVYDPSIIARPFNRKTKMRNLVLATIQLTLCLYYNGFGVKLIDDLAFGLIVCIKHRKIQICVPCNSCQRLVTLTGRFFEHSVKLSASTLLAREVFVLLFRITISMSICITLGMNQLMSEDFSNDHFLDEARLQQIADAYRSG